MNKIIRVVVSLMAITLTVLIFYAYIVMLWAAFWRVSSVHETGYARLAWNWTPARRTVSLRISH